MNTVTSSLCLLLALQAVVCAADPVDLRGYGKVAAELTPTRSVFTCESVEKADILLDKLQADLFWDKSLAVTITPLKSGVLVYTVPSYGSALIARAGKQVLVLGGADEKAVGALAAKEGLLKGKDVTSQAAKPRPMFLDFFDHKAFKINTSSTPAHWQFIKFLGGSLNRMGPQYDMKSPAPGVISWTLMDMDVQDAERQHEMIMVGPWAGPAPLWARNQDPDSIMRPSPTTLMGDWGGALDASSAMESWMTPLDKRLQRGLGFQRTAFERYRSSPSLGGWMIFAGTPGWEYSLGHGRAMQSWDVSPVGQAGFRRWLKDECRLSLADLGVRWHGDAKHFASWEDVRLPDMNEFFGELGPDSLRLGEGWRWQNQGGMESTPIDSADPGWIPVAMPPSQQLAFLPRGGVGYYDITLDPGAWLAKQAAGAEVWLVVALNGDGQRGTRIWLNGQALALPNDEASQNRSFAVKVTGQIKPGANQLQLALDASKFWFTMRGKPAGPIFLTTHEPKRFPYLGRQANARYADRANWQAWALTEYHRQLVRLARRLDPDRPFILSGGNKELYDYGVQLCVDFGMGQENTGREYGYRPHHPGSGLAAGYYGTSEFANTAEGLHLDEGFGYAMFDADSSHNLCQDLDAYQKREEEDGWFTRHRRQIGMLGKYLREQPKVALLLSGQSQRYCEVGYADIGVDALPAAHVDNVYVSEIGLRNGLADPYPLLFDIGNSFLEVADVAAIGRHVERGGTVIALGNSGLHTGLEPDTYPLAKVSGCRPAGERRGKLRFEAQLPIFKGWESREFEAQGKALEVVDAKSLVPLARWSDGSLAIGYRKSGKGQIITLGCELWKAKDLSAAGKGRAETQRGFFSQLLAEAGLARNADASVPEVWARKLVTKNGLQNWLVALNARNSGRQADLWMAVEGKPDSVIDLDTNQSVPFTVENNGITIKDVDFEPFALKYFAVRRATLAAALPAWWYEKTRYWKRTPAEVEAAGMVIPPVNQIRDESVIPIQQWRFRTDPDQQLVAQGAWNTLAFDDAAWQPKEAGPWTQFDPALRDYHGTGLYRCKFTMPPAWRGRRILLNLYDHDDPIVYDNGEFFVNGTSVLTYKARRWSQTLNVDITELVHPGDNLLALKAIGGKDKAGLNGSVWIEGRQPLSQSLDLAGTWQLVQADWLARDEVEIPNQGMNAQGKYLTRRFAVPAAWKGKEVFVEWSSTHQWAASVVINGRPIGYTSADHPFGLIANVNVSPYIKPGEDNVIELWSHRTMTWGGTTLDADTQGFQLSTIRIGCR